jgi:hypothetical protein
VERKLAGLVIGIIAVQALNIVRVISLFSISSIGNFYIFEGAHLYVWQALDHARRSGRMGAVVTGLAARPARATGRANGPPSEGCAPIRIRIARFVMRVWPGCR